MRKQQYLHVIDTGWTESEVPPVDLQSIPRPRLGDLRVRRRNRDAGMGQGERTQLRGDRGAESVRGSASGRGQLGGEPGQLGADLSPLRAQRVDPLVVALE